MDLWSPMPLVMKMLKMIVLILAKINLGVPSVHDASDTCMSISASTWFFEYGGSKHITSSKSLFTSLIDAPKDGSVTCANNASYVIKGIGQVAVTSIAGNIVTLENMLYVPCIHKNLISISVSYMWV